MFVMLRSKIDAARALLAFALVVGLVLRLYGIQWGLPDASHPIHSYHPDEALHLFAAEWFATGVIFPKHFMYGGTIYFSILNAISYIAESLQSVLDGDNLLADTILLGRYVLVGVAILTIMIVYRIGCLLYAPSVGALSALFLAVSPAHVVWAQRLRPDEIAAFLTVVIFYLAVKILQCKPKNLRYCVYAGLVLGAAVSLRFPLAIFASAPLAAIILASDDTLGIKRLRSFLDRRTIMMMLCVLFAYVVSSPQILMHPETFIAGLKVQWGYQSNPFPDAVEMGPGFYQYGWLMLHQALGYGLYVLAACGALYALIKRTSADWLLLAAIVPYLVLISFTSWVVVRYTLPLVPLLMLLAARLIHSCLNMRFPYRSASYVVVFLVVGWTMIADAAYLRLEAGKNVRELATEWIERNVPHGSRIVSVKTYLEDDFFNPVIPQSYVSDTFFLFEKGDGSRLFREQKHDYLILHEYLYKNMERLGARHPLIQTRIFHEALVSSRYRLIKEFKQPVTFFGIDFSSSFSSNDYTIVNPGIRVYQYQ